MSEVLKNTSADAPLSEKRVPKMSVKALSNFIEKCQINRQSKCKKATASMKNLEVLMDSKENVTEVQSELANMIKCFREAQENHDALLEMKLPEEQATLQNEWFKSKKARFCGFVDDAKRWLSEAGQPYDDRDDGAPVKDDVNPNKDGDLIQDDIRPDDSASNVSRSVSRSVSKSKVSTTSSRSERIKAEAEKAAIMERVVALKRMHELEAEEEQLRRQEEQLRRQEEQLRRQEDTLRRQKEQLTLETELAAFNAKLSVYEENASQHGSRASSSRHGRNYNVEKAPPHLSGILNPGAATYCPKERTTVGIEDYTAAPPLVVRPKERTTVGGDDYPAAPPLAVHPKERTLMGTSQPDEMNAHSQVQVPTYDNPFTGQEQTRGTIVRHDTQRTGLSVMQAPSKGFSRTMPKVHMQAKGTSVAHDTYMTPMVQTQSQRHPTGHKTQNPVLSDFSQSDIVSIMQRQNDITTLLVQQNLASALPPRQIPVFDGDPLQYHAFMRAFENGVEEKSNNYSDCLHFLEQYTRGPPKEIVHSCQHLPPEQGYQRAKNLLIEHFGNEYKISSAYMNKAFNWTPIKREDVQALQAFALFLRGCCNATEQIQYMRDLDMPSNMRTIVLKLPYSMRERWRNTACDLLERRGQRAMFSDLVGFIEKQVRIVTDPLFGNIQDNHTIGSISSQMKDLRERKGSSFATSVTAIGEKGRSEWMDKHSSNSAALPTFHGCMFCKKSGHSLEKCTQFKGKLHRDKINFIREKAICFGCLKVGHFSKVCKARMSCDICSLTHPGILHIHQQTKGIEQIKEAVRQVKGTLSQPGEEPKEPAVTTEMVAPKTCGHIGAGYEDDCIFSIVPVQVKAKKGDVVLQTYAFLDPGSSGTFCTDSLVQQLNVKKQRTNFLLRTLGQEKIIASHVVSGLQVSGLDNNDFIDLPDVVSQRCMPVTQHNIPRQDDVDKWPYLSGIKLHQIDSNIDLLIGTNASKVIEPWELINSQEDGPYAIRTKVGWVLNGPLRVANDSRSKSVSSMITANEDQCAGKACHKALSIAGGYG